MRITNNMLINNMMQSLSGNLSRTQKYYNQLATGKKISLPSDDPIVAAKSLKLRTDVSEIAQYKRNTDDATAWMDITEATMSQMTDLVHRMKEITNQAANGTNTDEDLLKIKEEANELRTQLISLETQLMREDTFFRGIKLTNPY